MHGRRWLVEHLRLDWVKMFDQEPDWIGLYK